ncbi:MAG TPA: hypothetical protein VHF23_01445, partial [Gaiellaceae bacterium]|nr:hypothetical protein [Gaiellaceae bacterium]
LSAVAGRRARPPLASRGRAAAAPVMDAAGARALARRIAGGPPSEPGPGRGGSSPERCRVIFGLWIYRTEEQPSLRDGRPVLVRRRVCKTLVRGRWISFVLREDD